MTIHAALHDLIKQCALNTVEIIKITGTERETVAQTFDADKTLFVVGTLHSPIKEFVGEFGMMNLKMLSGLLNFTAYRTEEESISVRSREIAGQMVLDQLEFKGKGSKSVYRLMDIKHVPKQPEISRIPWDVSIPGWDKSKLTEFQQFSSLYSEVEKQFTIHTEGTDLIGTFGIAAGSSHSGSMVLAENIEGTISNPLTFPVDKVLMLMKLAQNAQSCKLMFSNKNLLGVETVTDHGLYKYFLRRHVEGK